MGDPHHNMLEALAKVAKVAASAPPAALFAAVDECVHQVLQQTLCTVNRYNPENETLTRLYSSDPVAYPVGGSKDKAGTAWGRQVLHDKQLFIGEGEQAIRESFDDHHTIRALGLRSVINVPVVNNGVCLGTINLLMTADTIRPEMVQWARVAGLMATPGFLALPVTARGSDTSGGSI